MNRLRKSIRNKRYSIKKGSQVSVLAHLGDARFLEFHIVDCSLTGLRVTAPDAGDLADFLQEGALISDCKMKWADKEFSLGRMVVRRFQTNGKEAEVALSTVDSQVPVSSSLSKHLDHNFEREEGPDSKELSPDKFSLADFVNNEYQNVDILERTREFAHYHRLWVDSKKYAYQMVRKDSLGCRANLTRTRKNGRNDYLVFGSNDYFGLGADPRVTEAAAEALKTYGLGSTGSPVSTGTTYEHIKLGKTLANLHQKEATLLFNSGYAANVGTISALCHANDLIVADQLCHASIQDGMAMSKATSRFFKHNSPEHLEKILEKERDQYNGCLVITEGVFSMDGDLAVLDRIIQISRKYNCRIFVDQAHCFGVVGPNGLGICDKYDAFKEVDIIMGTFSKVCGGIGGFVCASHEVTDWLRYFARSQVFSVSTPPSVIAGVHKAIEIFTTDQSLLRNIHKNIQQFTSGLSSIGFTHLENHESSVVPVLIGNESLMGEIFQELLNDGIWCTPVVYPAVGRNNCRFRFTVMATHTVSELDYAVVCLEKAFKKVGFKPTSALVKKDEAA